MTRKLGDQALDTLERRFQALRDQLGTMPEACRPELEGALQELSQAIAALRAGREAGESSRPDPPGGREAQAGQAGKELLNQLLLDALPCVALLLRPGTREIVASNAEAVKSGALPGAQCFSTWGQREDPCPWCRAPALWATGEAQHLEVEALGVAWEAHWIPVAEDLYMHFAFDVTAHKQAESARRESEGTLRTLIEANPESLFLLDTRGIILAASRVAAERLGKELPEVVGSSAFEHLPPEVASRRWALFKQVIATGRAVRIEDVRGDRHFDINFNPILDADGKVSRVSILAIDITDRKQSEQALKESEERFRMLFDHAPDAYILAGMQGEIIDCNQATEDLTGYGREELIGNNFASLSIMDLQQQIKLMELLVQGTHGEILGPVDFTLTPKDGGEVIAEGMGLPLSIQGQNLVLTIVRDITARKRAEREIQRLASFPQMNPQPVLEMDIDGRITYYNQAALKALGKMGTAEDLNNFLPDDLQEILAKAKQNSKRHFQREVVVNGVVFLENIYFDEKFNAVRLYALDITARKQAEEALAAHLQFLQLLLDTIPNPIFFKDAQGAYLGCNKAFEDFLGITRQEIVGKSVYDLSPRELADEYHRMDLEAFQTTGIQVYESQVQAADGARCHVVFHKATFPDPTGGVGGLVGIITDITGLKQAEAELRESEQRFRLMAETIQDVFWIATPDIGKIMYVSPAYGQVWGRNCQDLYEHPQRFMESIHPEDREQALAVIVTAREQGSPSDHEYRIVKPDGAERWIHDRGFPVKDDQGQVILFTGVATDVTEHKALEGQLLQAQKMEAVGRLAGGVAHDFNNLLMAITGYGELMRANVLRDDPLYSHLENILKAGERAAALTQQLLTFSRQKVIQPQVIDLNRVVLDLEPMLRRLIGEDLDLGVVTNLRPGAVKADPGQMGQIIMNLVVNARDAMPQGGRLTLKIALLEFKESRHTRFGLAPPGAYVMLEVADTGVGMDEATQAHVFEPFFTTKEPGKGTGLGLSTVYGIVRQSGGYLDLESSPGAGSTFTIYLPRLEAIIEQPRAKIPITANFQGEETVLLVEDEDMLRGLLAKYLRLCGYTVLEARHGGEALLSCEQYPGPIHLMVTDVVMPQMSGRELADRLTPLRPEMKILYMSGYTENALVQHGVADLSAAFLQKPFRPIELARRVHAVLHPPVSQ